MRVITARDGMDAVALLQDNIPDVILLDIEMPRMDGYEVAAHVRNDPRLKDVPIIMVTSRVGEKHRARAIELGVDDYLGKPYQEAQLLDAIAPLADIPFNYSKSHLRALDAAALGIPVIAQDLPPYREFVVDGVTGYLVSTHDEWRARLTELINDEQAREEMGRKAREVAAGHTIQEHWVRWQAAYEMAARSR